MSTEIIIDLSEIPDFDGEVVQPVWALPIPEVQSHPADIPDTAREATNAAASAERRDRRVAYRNFVLEVLKAQPEGATHAHLTEFFKRLEGRPTNLSMLDYDQWTKNIGTHIANALGSLRHDNQICRRFVTESEARKPSKRRNVEGNITSTTDLQWDYYLLPDKRKVYAESRQNDSKLGRMQQVFCLIGDARAIANPERAECKHCEASGFMETDAPGWESPRSRREAKKRGVAERKAQRAANRATTRSAAEAYTDPIQVPNIFYIQDEAVRIAEANRG